MIGVFSVMRFIDLLGTIVVMVLPLIGVAGAAAEPGMTRRRSGEHLQGKEPESPWR